MEPRSFLVCLGFPEYFLWKRTYTGPEGAAGLSYLADTGAPFIQKVLSAEVLTQCFVQVRRADEGRLVGRSH